MNIGTNAISNNAMNRFLLAINFPDGASEKEFGSGLFTI